MYVIRKIHKQDDKTSRWIKYKATWGKIIKSSIKPLEAVRMEQRKKLPMLVKHSSQKFVDSQYSGNRSELTQKEGKFNKQTT